MPQANPQIIQMAAEAAKRGLSLEAYMRMMQGPAGIMQQPQVEMPQQKPFAEGYGPGGQLGAGQGQNDQAWGPSQFGGGQQQSPGIGPQISPAGYQEQVPQEADTSIWGQIKSRLGIGAGPDSGVVPFGQRLGNIGTILSAASDPHGRALAPTLARVNEQYGQQQDVADQKAAYYAEQKKQQLMAESLYENLKDTNPQVAEMIRANPGLVKNYMEGVLDIEQTKVKEGLRAESDLKVQTAQDKAAMDRLQYQTDNDPTTRREQMKIDAENKRWEGFLDANDLRGASTLEIYSKKYKDPNMTENEAATLASAHMQGGEDKLDSTYQQILDNRDNRAQTTAAQQAAAVAGIKLKDGQRITNIDEVIASNGKVAPKVEWIEGTEEATALKAKEGSDWRSGASDYLATQRAIDAVDLQLTGDAMTGAGVSAYGKMLPETNARELANALSSINAGGAFQKLAEIRASTPAGSGVGNVTEGEYPLLTAADGEKYDIYQEPALLKKRLVQHKNLQTAFMAPSPENDTISVLQQLVNDLRASPTPEHKKEFDAMFGSGYSDLVIAGPAEIPK